jgi:hypothetical protein
LVRVSFGGGKNVLKLTVRETTESYTLSELYATLLKLLEKLGGARHQWLTPVITATQEAEIRRITV